MTEKPRFVFQLLTPADWQGRLTALHARNFFELHAALVDADATTQ